jgi:hypothetical protein
MEIGARERSERPLVLAGTRLGGAVRSMGKSGVVVPPAAFRGVAQYCKSCSILQELQYSGL